MKLLEDTKKIEMCLNALQCLKNILDALATVNYPSEYQGLYQRIKDNLNSANELSYLEDSQHAESEEIYKLASEVIDYHFENSVEGEDDDLLDD